MPALNANFRPPRPGNELLPEDWDADVEPPAAAQPNERGSEPAIPPSYPTSWPATPLPAAPLPAALLPAAPLPTAEPAGAPPAPSAEGRGAADAAAFAAFAAGAGLAGHPAGDPNEALRELGAAFRAVVSGLRRMMIARATIKGEFRIGQTMIQPIGNNPLKFAADDDDALAALLGIGRQGGMSPARAVSDALQDMRLHELAVAAAMQTAVREVMGELDPARIMREQPPRAFEAVFGRAAAAPGRSTKAGTQR